MTQQTGHITDNVELLRQGVTAIAIVGPGVYGGESGAGVVSPIGAHFRHVFDHYNAFLNGLSTGALNYDVRERDPLVERDVTVASQTAETIMARLEEIQDQQLPQSIQVSANVIEAGKSAVDWSDSTVHRELMYLLSHTVHHYAIIRLLATQAGVELNADFGVAPSTIAHRRLHEACAPSAG
jgi:uncharacterized damage-inducible protein DinB